MLFVSSMVCKKKICHFRLRDLPEITLHSSWVLTFPVSLQAHQPLVIPLGPKYPHAPTTSETRSVKQATFSFQRKRFITCFPIWNYGNWRLLIIQLSEGPGLMDPHNQDWRYIYDSLDDLYNICISRGSPKFPQPGPQVANGPNDFYCICMTKIMPEPSLGLKLTQVANLYKPSFWKKK